VSVSALVSRVGEFLTYLPLSFVAEGETAPSQPNFQTGDGIPGWTFKIEGRVLDVSSLSLKSLNLTMTTAEDLALLNRRTTNE